MVALAALGPSPFADAARSARRKVVAVMSDRSVGELADLTARTARRPVGRAARRRAARHRA